MHFPNCTAQPDRGELAYGARQVTIMTTAMDTATMFGAIGLVSTSSHASSDIDERYELGANSHLRKPGNLSDFFAAAQSMADFGSVSLPQKEKQ